MKKNSKKKKNNNKSIILIVIALVLIAIIGGTYAWLTITKTGEKVNTIVAGTLRMDLDDRTSEGIEILDAVPTTDDTGKSGPSYSFTLENTGTIIADYTVLLESQSLDSLNQSGIKNMPTNRIKYNIKKTVKEKVGDVRNSDKDTVISSDNEGVISFLSDTDGLDKGSLEPNRYIEYTLTLWIDKNASFEEMEDTAYIGNVKLYANQQGIE